MTREKNLTASLNETERSDQNKLADQLIAPDIQVQGSNPGVTKVALPMEQGLSEEFSRDQNSGIKNWSHTVITENAER